MTITTEYDYSWWCIPFGLCVRLADKDSPHYCGRFGYVSVHFLCWALCFAWETK